MMTKIFVSLSAVFIYFTAGCSGLTDEELWLKIESAKKSSNWDSTQHMCEMLLNKFPKSSYAPWARFGLAESYRFQNHPREALDNYKIFYEHYPHMQPSALSLFLIGYVYNNNFHMIDSAQYYYGLFLEKFPDHDLAPIVKKEIEFIGKNPDQVLNELHQGEKALSEK